MKAHAITLPCYALYLIALVAHSTASPDSTSHPYHGSAFDTERNVPAYTEDHKETFLKGKRIASQTVFKAPDEKPMGELTLDFLRFQCKPDYDYKDFRNGYEEGAKADSVSVHAFFRDSARAPLKEKALEVPEPCVINGGVEEFVKMNWEEIVSGKKIPFNMVIPARLDYYRFVAYQDPKYVVPEKEAGGRDYRPVVIEPKNSVLAMLLPTIVMYYDVKTKRLIRYQGIVNVADAKGRSLRVKVDYPGLGP